MVVVLLLTRLRTTAVVVMMSLNDESPTDVGFGELLRHAGSGDVR